MQHVGRTWAQSFTELYLKIPCFWLVTHYSLYHQHLLSSVGLPGWYCYGFWLCVIEKQNNMWICGENQIFIFFFFPSVLTELNFTNQNNNHLSSGKCCEWRASVAGDKCFWGPLLPGGGKLPSQILSELFPLFLLSFWGNKPDFRLIQYSDTWELELFAVVDACAPERMQKAQKASLLLGEKTLRIFVQEWI